MKYIDEYFFCSPILLNNLEEIEQIFKIVESIKWMPEFSLMIDDKRYEHQRAYNKAFEIEFLKLDWEPQPKLCEDPKLIGDFSKNEIFVEIQFGNSATIYRDYYKFHYGLTYNHLVLALMIVPTDPKKFFPSRPKSVGNMAEFKLANKYFKLLPIPVPILLIGLLPENL